MKIGTAAFRLMMGTCGVSAWIGRTTDVDVGTGKADGLAVRDYDSRETAAAIHDSNPAATFDCESQLVSTLRLTCHDTEAERIGVSIALTLCSISSARQEPPTECKAWSTSRIAGNEFKRWREMPGDGMRDINERGRCLEALHRSPQDWSSYNGYLSNAMQLCHALYGKQQEEIARSIYANISQEKMDLLSYLRQNEETRMVEQERLKQALQFRIQDLGSLHESAKQQHEALATLISNSSSSADQAYSRLLQTIIEMRNVGEEWWEEVQTRVQEQVDIDAANVRQVMDTQMNEMRSFLAWLSAEVAEKQRQEIVSLAIQHRAHMDGVWTDGHNHIARLVQELSSVTDTVNDRFRNLDAYLSRLSQELENTSILALQLSPTLQQALNQSHQLHLVQLLEENATRQNMELAEIMHNKLFRTLELAEKSNDAFDDLVERITKQSSLGFPISSYLEIAGTFLPYFSSPMLTAFKSQPFVTPLLPMVAWLGAVLINALTFAFYSVTTVWVIFRTGTWRLARRAYHILYSEYQALRQDTGVDLERNLKSSGTGTARCATNTYHTTYKNNTGSSYSASHHAKALPTNRKLSLGRQIDMMARRAQSEPLL